MNCPFFLFVKTICALMMMIYAGFKILQWKSFQNLKTQNTKPQSNSEQIDTSESNKNPSSDDKIDSSIIQNWDIFACYSVNLYAKCIQFIYMHYQ